VIGTRTLANGSATVIMPTNALSAGSYTITATYATQGNYTGSSATITQVIQ
jgi:hypothetical protein